MPSPCPLFFLYKRSIRTSYTKHYFVPFHHLCFISLCLHLSTPFHLSILRPSTMLLTAVHLSTPVRQLGLIYCYFSNTRCYHVFSFFSLFFSLFWQRASCGFLFRTCTCLCCQVCQALLFLITWAVTLFSVFLNFPPFFFLWSLPRETKGTIYFLQRMILQ